MKWDNHLHLKVASAIHQRSCYRWHYEQFPLMLIIIIIHYNFLHPEFFSILNFWPTPSKLNTKRSRIKSFVYLRIE